jgi:hypothetical protein
VSQKNVGFRYGIIIINDGVKQLVNRLVVLEILVNWLLCGERERNKDEKIS